jgi:choline kinase
MKAVILAAGMGTRLGQALPKPLTDLGGGLTLLGNQITLLSRHLGVSSIRLVLGYRAQTILDAVPRVEYVINPDYASTNTSKSLLLGMQGLDEDMLWINGDVYFTDEVLELMLDDAPAASRTLVRPCPTCDEDVKYTLHPDGTVAGWSKEVRQGQGESLGMQVAVTSDLPVIRAALDVAYAQAFFEQALEPLCLQRQLLLHAIDVGTRFCTEVDFPDDLQAVRAYLGQARGA